MQRPVLSRQVGFRPRLADAQGILTGAALAALAVFGVFPLGILLWRSFYRAGEVTLGNYTAGFTNPANLLALWNTIVVGALVVAACILLGAPLAWLLTRTDVPGRSLWRTVFLIPYLFPPAIGAIAWIQLLNPRVGQVNLLLQPALGVEHGPFNVHSLGGLVWVLALFWYCLVFLSVSAALERMDPSLEEAARISGAGTLRTMRDVTLPLAMPSIVASGLLVFLGTAASFSVAGLIGERAGLYVLSTRIASAALNRVDPNALSESTALSVALMALGVAGFFVSRRLTGRRQYTTVTGKANRPEIVALGSWRLPLLGLLVLLAAVIVFLPLGAVVLASLLRSSGREVRLENLTLDNYWYILFRHHLTAPGLRNSVLLAAGSATAVVGAGAILAYARLRGGRRLGALADLLATLPNATPATVLGLGMILAFSGRYGINLYNTFAILLAAYVAKDLVLGLRTISASLQQVHVSLEEAARVSGAGWLRTFRDVVLPLVRPALVAGWFIAFTTAVREINLTILLYGPRTPTAGVALYVLQYEGYDQYAAALAVVLLVVVLAGNAAIRRITRGAAGI